MSDTKWNSIDEFAASIKEKFPVYKDRDNADLARAMFEKYPQYVAQVQTSQPRKKSTYSSAPPSNVPFLRLAIPELEKSRDEAIAKGDVSTAKEKELFRSTGQGISDLVSDPGNLALGAASMIPGARLALAPVLGALGLHGMAASGTNIKDIGQETAYATGLSQTPGKYTTPEAAQQYLQSAAMGVGGVAASGEKGATEPTAKLLDRIKKAYVASGQLKSGKPGTPYAKTAMQETGRVAGAVGGYSMGAEFSHPIIAAIVGGKLGKGVGTGAYETGRIVLEAAPKALRSKAFEAYQDSLNRDLFSKSPATGAPGASSGGPGGGTPPAVGPTPAPGGATAQAAGAGVGATTSTKQLPAPKTQPTPEQRALTGEIDKAAAERAARSPERTANIGRGQNGMVRVSFPDEVHKDLYSYQSRVQKNFSGTGKFDVNSLRIRLSKELGVSESMIPQMSREYREYVNKEVKGKEEGDFVKVDTHREATKNLVMDMGQFGQNLTKIRQLVDGKRVRPIKVSGVASGQTPERYEEAFRVATQLVPSQLGPEGQLIVDAISRGRAESGWSAEQALGYLVEWVNHVQQSAARNRPKGKQ